ncbi:MAG TPA: SUMF1/EgtB/PvdO family nonheme iron enzyme [Lacipirellulaceae bacterium]|jgi:formylglycine-generating enzyme required for sulfatase activity
MSVKRLAILLLCGPLIAQTARADVFHMAPGLTSLQFVTVGNPGNAPDTRYNNIAVGSVDHVYQMGKYEITAGQYTEFLNAVAKDDPTGLYNPYLSDPSGLFTNGGFVSGGAFGADIQRSGTSPNFSYSVAPDWANRPVNYVSFWDAARFCNWLHNGQPTGPQEPGTTENGAYHDLGDPLLFGLNPGARFFISTQDEWYKAAYHNKSAGLTADYFDYPTSSNSPPTNALPDQGNHANLFDGFGTGNGDTTIGGPYYRTEVGAFANSPSPYGTFDQGGNVWEWIETPYAPFPAYRGLEGGSFINSSDILLASFRGGFDDPANASLNVGFRIATAIPEPSTFVLVVLSGGLIMSFRKRFIA